MEQLNINEVHKRVLEIAKEFVKICNLHSIPYYMIGGSMLGAIRHKGFIPWDDDMDFGVPIEHYQDLICYLERELPSPFRCCTYKNHPAHLYNYIKIEDQTTCIDDVAIDLPLEQKLGVNIDVFPLNVCTFGGRVEKRIRRYTNLLGKAYLKSINHTNSGLRLLVKKGLQLVLLGNPERIQNKIDRMLVTVNKGECLGNLIGRWGEKEIVPISWYGNGKLYEFEGTSFVGIEKYDAYLSRLYGDYMRLPPEKERIAHIESVYKR